MKPRNKFQHRIVEASKKLTKLTKEQIEWSKNNVIDHIGRRNDKGKITCTKCTHSWQGVGLLVDTLTDCICPYCKAKLAIKTTNKRVFRTNYYMTIITACEGYQVVRSIMVKCTARVGQLPEYEHSEVMQRWIAPNGKHVTFAILRQTMGTMSYVAWIHHTFLELRQENDIYNRIFTDVIYPRQKLIPELKRTGLKKSLYAQKPLELFRTLLTDCRAETLLKARQTKLFKRIMDMGWTRNIDNYWQSIKICIRNGYKIKDATLWCDYIDLLRFFGKDLHNAKYVCPIDLKKEHDHYIIKKAKADAQQEIKKQLEKEAEYREVKAKFFGLMFSDGLINVRVLESVKEIILEGKLMHHCVGSYHTKTDSLILSACIDGKKIETIEVSLTQLRVIQSRGVCNKNTKYHNRIVNLTAVAVVDAILSNDQVE